MTTENAIMINCEHESPYIDHCSECAPWWGKYFVCPVHYKTKLTISGYCDKCKKHYKINDGVDKLIEKVEKNNKELYENVRKQAEIDREVKQKEKLERFKLEREFCKRKNEIRKNKEILLANKNDIVKLRKSGHSIQKIMNFMLGDRKTGINNIKNKLK